MRSRPACSAPELLLLLCQAISPLSRPVPAGAHSTPGQRPQRRDLAALSAAAARPVHQPWQAPGCCCFCFCFCSIPPAASCTRHMCSCRRISSLRGSSSCVFAVVYGSLVAQNQTTREVVIHPCCVGHKKEEALKEVRTLASASAACLPGATSTWLTASMGRWASGNQTPGGPAGARRLLTTFWRAWMTREPSPARPACRTQRLLCRAGAGTRRLRTCSTT